MKGGNRSQSASREAETAKLLEERNEPQQVLGRLCEGPDALACVAAPSLARKVPGEKLSVWIFERT